MDERASETAPFCPSAQPEMSDALVLGVVQQDGDVANLAYLRDHQPATTEILNLVSGVRPTEVFRFAARCEGSACRHFDGADCKLVTRIVKMLPAITDSLPPCRIRAECRWFHQEGRAACMRCPQIVTEALEASDEMRAAAEE